MDTKCSKKNLLILTWQDLIDTDEYGGNEVYINNIAEKLAHKYNITIFSSKKKTQKRNEVIKGIKYIRYGSRYTVYLWAFLYYIVKLRKTVDVILDTENGIPFFTPLYSKKPKILLVHHFHNGQWFKEFGMLGIIGYLTERFLMPKLYNRTKVITVSESSKLDLEFLGFNSKNISIAYNGVVINDTLVDKVKNRTLYSQPTVLYLGRLRKYKRIDLLIHMVNELKDEMPNIHLIIAGRGDYEKELKELVDELKLQKFVSFYGFVDEKTKYELLKRSWVFANPSEKEGWGIVNIEANYFGTPVVGFNVYGIRDSVNNNYSGFLAVDFSDFVEKTKNLLSDKELLKTMGNNAKLWSSNFGWDKTASTVDNVIENVIKFDFNKKFLVKTRKFTYLTETVR